MQARSDLPCNPSLPTLIVLRDAADSWRCRRGEGVTECAETMFPDKEKLCVLGSPVSNHHYEVGWRIRVTINPNPSALEGLQVSFSLRANTPSQASLKDDHIVTGSAL